MLVSLLAVFAVSGSLSFVANEPRKYDFADQSVLPPEFGVGEFTMELWIKPDNSFPVGDVERGTIGQLKNWSAYDIRPYSTPDWWYAGNWLLDGHSRPAGYDVSDSRAGTFSLQFYGGGRLRWMFSDDDKAVPVGMVWAAQAKPARSAPSLLDGKWHHVACVRRWTRETGAALELWVDGVLTGSETIPQRVNMRKFWSRPPHPSTTAPLGGWCWGSEVMTAWGMYFTQYEDYKGLLDELSFWSRAKPPEELRKPTAVKGGETGLVGWFPFDGGSVVDRVDASRGMTLHGVAASGEDAVVKSH